MTTAINTVNTEKSKSILKLDSIYKSFGKENILNGINLSVKEGEFITLLGPSGCGKTTTLRIIAGLETPDSGKVYLEGEDVTSLEPNKRGVNTVFQNYALFPHMTVEANIGYSLKLRHIPKAEIKKEVKRMLELVQLEGYEKRMPSELSGGQRQRVAIARSVINKPKILLLDEPLGALDLRLRRQMQTELKRLQKKLNLTFIYITHDQEEALNMSDKIIVMDKGNFQQIGTPSELYDSPKTSFVAQFVGSANIISGTVKDIKDDVVYLKNNDGVVCFHSRGHKFKEGMQVSLAVRGEQTSLAQSDISSGQEEGCLGLKGTVKEKRFSGGMLHISIALSDGNEFVCNSHGIDSPLSVGEKVSITWPPENAAPVDLKEEEA